MSNEAVDQGNLLFQDGWSQLYWDPDILEAGGEHVNEGTDFARYWVISALIDRELAGDTDYVILFEYLQDVAILETTSGSTTATLYQLKKKERGQWTKAGLCKKDRPSKESQVSQPSDKKGKKKNKLVGRSPLAKLYLCVDRLSSHVLSSSGVFLSNAPISLKLANGELIPCYSRTALSALQAEVLADIESQIADELGLKVPLAACAAVHLEQTTISPAAMRETVRGLVAEYLCQKHSSVPNVSGQLVERLLESFSRRSGPKPTMMSLADIIEHKGFTRSHFTAILSQISATQSHPTRLDKLLSSLEAEGIPSRRVARLRQAAISLQTQLVRHPESKDSLHWDIAVEAVGATDEDGDYSSATAHVAEQLRLSFKGRNATPPSEIDLQSLAILAIIYVEESTSFGAQSKD